MEPTHRYLAILVPSASIAEEVVRMRELLYEHIGGFTGRILMPHITLFLADVPEVQGEAIGCGVEMGVRGATPFELSYAGITHFSDQRTIFIDPVEKNAIATVRDPIVEAVSAQLPSPSFVRATLHPHLTIAAGLKPSQFAAAWTLLAPHAFTAKQHVDRVMLLRRPLEAGAVYTAVRSFPFVG